jgi:predicted GNAT family acetyltransferase
MRRRGPVPFAVMREGPDMITVSDNPKASRYEARIGDEIVGFAEYRQIRNRIVFTHTETLDAFAGHGVGSRLAAGALDDVRARGLRATPHCPFIRAYIERHPQYADLVIWPGRGPAAGA